MFRFSLDFDPTLLFFSRNDGFGRAATREMRLFCELDALTPPSPGGERVLRDLLKKLGLFPKDSADLEAVRRLADEAGAPYTESEGSNEFLYLAPWDRTAIAIWAAKDRELQDLLEGADVHASLMGDMAGRALYQTLALWGGKNAKARSLYDKEPWNYHRVALAFELRPLQEDYRSQSKTFMEMYFRDIQAGLLDNCVIHRDLEYLVGLWERGKVAMTPAGQAAYHFWTGNFDALETLLSGGDLEPATLHLLRGMLALVRDDASALEDLEKARELAPVRSEFAGKLGGTPGIFLNLARLLYGGEEGRRAMRAEMKEISELPVSPCESAWFGKRGHLAVQGLDLLSRGETKEATALSKKIGVHDLNHYSCILAMALRVRAGTTDSIDNNFCKYMDEIFSSYPLLLCFMNDVRRNLRGYKGKYRPALARPTEFRMCLDMVTRDLTSPTGPGWSKMLDAIEHVVKGTGTSNGKEGGEKEKRILWEVSLDKNRIGIIEQTRGVRGWYKGKLVPLRRYVIGGSDFPWVTQQDIRILACAQRYAYWKTDYYLPLSAAVAAIEGHPGLVECGEDGSWKPLKVVRGDTAFRLEQNADGKYLLTASPEVMRSVRSQRSENEYPCFREGQTITYYPLSRKQTAIFRLLGPNGLTLPAEALGRVLALTGEGEGFSVVTDAKADVREAVPTPVVRLSQSGRGFAAKIVVRPFGGESPLAFPAGKGPQEPVAAVSGDGTGPLVPVRVHRDFAAETAERDALLRAAPALQENMDESFEWTGDSPEEVLTLLEELGQIDIPHTVEWPKGKAVHLGRSLVTSDVRVTLREAAGHDWFDVDGSVAVDEDRVLSLRSLLKGFTGSRFVALSESEYVSLTEELRRQLRQLKQVTATGARGSVRVNALGASAIEPVLAGFDIESDEAWKASVARMRAAFASDPAVPRELHCALRDYQVEGFQWMARLAAWGVGACLADDMGLGKTVQTLGVMVDLAKKGPCLVVAPTSVLANWEAEMARFAPGLRPVRLPARDRKKAVRALGPNDVLVVGYGLLPHVEAELASREWAMAVFDEAQALKNAATRRAKAGKKLEAGFRVALTGTPIENRLDDLWSIFNIINPGLLGSSEDFRKRFGRAAPGTGAAKILRALIRPFILRRLKSAVLEELPARTEQNILVEASAKEASFYEALRREAVDALAAEHPADATGGTAQSRRFAILAALTKLRRACCDSTLAAPDVAAAAGIASSKTERFVELVQELAQAGHRILAFSQFTTYLELVGKALASAGVNYLYLDGKTPEKERQKRLAAFQAGEGDVFLLSLKAGGTGVNLTAADYVIHLDPWWNPAVEDQASDRAHRIGQKRPVTIYRLVMAGTVEEKILALHRQKRELAADFLEGTETGVTSLTEEELLALLKS